MCLLEGRIVLAQDRLNGRAVHALEYYYCINVQYSLSVYLVQQLIRRNLAYPVSH
jgi:hypothetical protein